MVKNIIVLKTNDLNVGDIVVAVHPNIWINCKKTFNY